ncbi:4Fe-4S binding domain-containing protein [Balnearium lithotrophicum]|uniref:4Fe-4S binding domain-containing protein n=1 Tax=Balnearium lithotrophicum TaxID=223788 RepID=A0A521DM70_9BACT|nr:4Fe-4S binding protein [Balnearium lithotrophicum]SMO72807.1 4Fe-4S binding domain-containing protein [Balnearium lithotrophicum]
MFQLPEKFAYWWGIPREEIDWYPKIDESKCVGCGMCFLSCGRKVFDYDFERRKSVVARPLQCMVGCTSCEVWCVFNAISFPDRNYVKELIKKKGILKKVKEKLEELRENQ